MDAAIRELRWGIAAGVVWNVCVAFVMDNAIQPSTRTWFVVMGAANELLGVLMIASPELLPLLESTRKSLAGLSKRAVAGAAQQVRRLLHQRTTHPVSSTGSLPIESELSALLLPKPPSTLKEAAEWITRHEQELRQHERIFDQLPQQWQRDVAEAERRSDERAAARVHGLADRRLALRLLGVSFLVLGILLGTAGNLIT